MVSNCVILILARLWAFHLCPHATVTWSPWVGGMRQYIIYLLDGVQVGVEEKSHHGPTPNFDGTIFAASTRNSYCGHKHSTHLFLQNEITYKRSNPYLPFWGHLPNKVRGHPWIVYRQNWPVLTPPPPCNNYCWTPNSMQCTYCIKEEWAFHCLHAKADIPFRVQKYPRTAK